MSLSLYLMFLIILLCSILIIYKTIYYNKKITPMAGMMVAMALGIRIGVTIGVMLVILISDYVFIATVVGMLVGMLVGFLAGIPVNPIAALDGLLPGLMGRMMRACNRQVIVNTFCSLTLNTFRFE